MCVTPRAANASALLRLALMIWSDGHVPGALDEIPKLVVKALLTAPRGRHGNDHRPFPHGPPL